MSHSPSNRYYTRFIPREEVGEVTQWQFGAVSQEGAVLEPLDAPVRPAEPAAAVEPDVPTLPTAEHEALLAQARAEAYAQGLAEGQEQAALQWQQRLDDYIAGQGREGAQRLGALARALEESFGGLQQAMAQEVLELACDIARQVVRRELALQRDAVLPVVREALSMLVGESRPATVRLNPQDWGLLEQPLRSEFPGARIEWLPDAAVGPGECLVESAGMVIDGTLDKRWRRAIAALGLTGVWREAGHGD
ncbi:FliH/SctL family protein [Melaminivora alkalimesophila]|uniref:Flagellar assembly protein FliH n=1 Tax=Melaminivora alkalimesophila TaxID=1165852 RepID=A0A317R9E0_9BURK|nr:FliH/SctL family protein [Melaminivora alkalimesophila]PWW44461.1 flagellar assembly protein FliH [Melaminivora alkalimesophila]